MRVLVLGGTGFIGYFTVWRLLAAGHRVTVFNRGKTADPFGARIERLQGDRSTGEVAALREQRFDAAIDFTAYRPAELAPVIEVLGHGSVGHYVFVSTGQVYLVREGVTGPAREEDYDGALLPEPTATEDRAEWRYGIEKRECEDLLMKAFDSERFPVTRVRLPMVHGPRDPRRRLERYLWRILDGGPVILPDGGKDPIRHVDVGEVARGLTELLGRAEAMGQAFNLCQEEVVDLHGLVAMLGNVLGAPVPTVEVSRAAIRDAGLDPRAVSPLGGRWMSFLSPDRIREKLGFVHAPLRECLARTVSAFLANPPAVPPPGYEHRETERQLVGL
jgi:nucleoside-diphosphate-sugar epimerase